MTKFVADSRSNTDLSQPMIRSDHLGVIPLSSKCICVWWSLRLRTLTEAAPNVDITKLKMSLLIEGRNGTRRNKEYAVSRLHANLNIDKLSPGARITAYLSMESSDGLIHLLSSRSIILPSSSSTKKQPSLKVWAGSEPKDTATSTPRLDTFSSAKVTEHLPWEHLS